MEFCPTVLVTDEKQDETSFRLDTSETGRLETAVTKVVLAATQLSTETAGAEFVELEPFAEAEVEAKAEAMSFRVLPSAIAN
jgi:hypothetical protein